jgi:hypothetical protein
MSPGGARRRSQRRRALFLFALQPLACAPKVLVKKHAFIVFLEALAET